jgi:hypothetical protein
MNGSTQAISIESGEKVFQFCSSAYLDQLTGKKAHDLEKLLELLRSCSATSIFYHTFSALRRMRPVQAPYNNDFAVWISEHLKEDALAEKLMVIDITCFQDLESLRERIIETIEGYRAEDPEAFKKKSEEAFFLCDVVRFVYLTDKFAYDLKSFAELLDTISVDSLYYHFIESRLHNPDGQDDFSLWMEKAMGKPELAARIRSIDVSIYTLEELRDKIIDLVMEETRADQPDHPA